MARYIDADRLIEKIEEYKKHILCSNEYFNEDYKMNRVRWLDAELRDVINAPTADVQEVKHGFYVGLKGHHIQFICRICSNCGDIVPVANYCMWCGAKMDLIGETEK